MHTIFLKLAPLPIQSDSSLYRDATQFSAVGLLIMNVTWLWMLEWYCNLWPQGWTRNDCC